MSNNDIEYHHAELTVQVAIPVDSETDENHRNVQAEHFVTSRLLGDDGEDVDGEFINLIGVAVPVKTETADEAASRHDAKLEIAAEKKLDEQREQFFDRRGHF
jgi:hypothetical protein